MENRIDRCSAETEERENVFHIGNPSKAIARLPDLPDAYQRVLDSLEEKE